MASNFFKSQRGNEKTGKASSSSMDSKAELQEQLHFVLFPVMAQGHMIPMVDVAKLLAQRSVKVTIVTTPQNASRFEPTLNRANQSGLQIHLLSIEYPSQQLGFPKHCESLDSLPSLAKGYEFFSVSTLLQKPVEKLIQNLTPKPSCIISDILLPYTAEIAHKFEIPRISFLGTNCFFSVIIDKLKLLNPHGMNAESPYFQFLIPGLSDPVQLTAAQLPKSLPPELKHYRDQILASTRDMYGLIVNSFEELEPVYAQELKKTRNGIWCVGPVSLCNEAELDKAERGNKASIDEHECLKWLDLWEPNSVIYVCMGSICNLIPTQLIELGLGLESSKRPFIWVRRKESKSEEMEKWIQENGFEERIKRRGLLIRGWAPQVMILSHPSVGGFLTHCGWNSTIEGICAGVPLITWPLFADQLINEKLVDQILQIAVRVGVELPVNWGEEEEIGVLVRKEDVKEAIDKLMDGGEESKERRRRVKELAEMAKRAVAEGGSSYLNITRLIEDIKQRISSSQSN